MVGLYETAIESLCDATERRRARVRPKIIASTATVRRAREQIRALFGRRDDAAVPAAGRRRLRDVLRRGRSRRAPGGSTSASAAPGRAHEGDPRCAPTSRSSPRRSRLYEPTGRRAAGRPVHDARRLLQQPARARRHAAPGRGRGPHALRAGRGARPARRCGAAPAGSRARELQASRSSSPAARAPRRSRDAKARLRAAATATTEHVDVVLASNMISVGVDIDRLGLMVVAGQPKTTSEYIQAIEPRRPRRRAAGPGRDLLQRPQAARPLALRALRAYHESFYRDVEATSVTPFSGPALDRGLAGTLVAMTRLLRPGDDAAARRRWRSTTHRALGRARRRARWRARRAPARHRRATATSARRRGSRDARPEPPRCLDRDRAERAARARRAQLLAATTAQDGRKPLLLTPLDEDRPPRGQRRGASSPRRPRCATSSRPCTSGSSARQLGGRR